MSTAARDNSPGHTVDTDRYLETDGRVYRWDRERHFLSRGSTEESRIADTEEADRILPTGVDISTNRALRIVELVPTNPATNESEAADQ